MAGKTKKALVAVTTPKGVAVWPHLHAPDTKFDAAGVYTCKIRLDGPAADPVKAKIRLALNDAQVLLTEAEENFTGKLKKNEAFTLDDEPWTEEEDGSVSLNFKMKAKGTSKDGTTFDRAPVIYDANLKVIPKGTRIGGGSTIRIAGELLPYYNASTKTAGVSLRLISVQVIELRQYGEKSAAEFGFEAEEGGYSSEDQEESAGKAAFGDGEEQAGDEDGGEEGDF